MLNFRYILLFLLILHLRLPVQPIVSILVNDETRRIQTDEGDAANGQSPCWLKLLLFSLQKHTSLFFYKNIEKCYFTVKYLLKSLHTIGITLNCTVVFLWLEKHFNWLPSIVIVGRLVWGGHTRTSFTISVLILAVDCHYLPI